MSEDDFYDYLLNSLDEDYSHAVESSAALVVERGRLVYLKPSESVYKASSDEDRVAMDLLSAIYETLQDPHMQQFLLHKHKRVWQ